VSGRTVYAYADGNPISEDDPTGEAPPWGGINQGVTPTGAQAIAAVADGWNRWNSPDPCMKRYLEKQYGKYGPKGIGFLSLASLIPGPWNLSSPGDAWGDWAITFGGKVPIAQGISKAFGAAGAEAVGAFGTAGLALTIGATAENIHAFNVPPSKCGCDSQ
jgi:hypothetical protein